MITIMVAATDSGLSDEFWKAAFSVVLASIFAWLVGTRITYYWDGMKRRRESDLEASNDFYRVYGKFFSTWKLWDTYKSEETKITKPDGIEWTLLTKAEEAEADFEAFLVKLTSERDLSDPDVRLLACFRQGYQSLREHIRSNKPLEWWASDIHGLSPGFPRYQSFKALSEYFASLLATDQAPKWYQRASRKPDANKAISHLLDATFVVKDWEIVARKELMLDEILAQSIWSSKQKGT